MDYFLDLQEEENIYRLRYFCNSFAFAQAMDLKKMSCLKQGWKMIGVNIHLAVVNKIEQEFQIGCGHSWEKDNGVFAWCCLKK